ncbi:MAG TPA: adenylyltransferase/cytidyltransferase family protein [Mycobacteriales bacterium]|jgi:glycerol-3-phosphate cytidylyltransferase|nr:adenylyltransferase/cytidyltransferase family protein [Mycobacteriales bacterium]
MPERHGVVGYAPGVYDLFHIGHLNILRRAKAECDHLIAGVVSDELAFGAKGQWPVVPLAERLEIIDHIRFVDEAIPEVLPTKLEVWDNVRFHRIFKGNDWQGTAKGVALERDFAPLGVEVVYFPYTVQTSSTILRRALEGDRRPA